MPAQAGTLILVTLLLARFQLPPTGDPWQDRLIAARVAESKWLVAEPEAYDFTVSVRCACPNLPAAPQTFHVEKNQPTPVGALTPEARKALAPFDTIDELFDTIRRSMSAVNWSPSKFDARYDPEFSYPAHVDLDPSNTVSGDEVAFDVTAFKVVRK